MFNKNLKSTPLYYSIIQQLYYGQSLSCAELSLKIEKSIPIVTKALNELIQAEYVIELGYAVSSGGRRPQMYAVKSDRLYIVKVAMDQLSTRIGVTDLLNNFVLPVEMIELKLQNNPDALQTLVELINQHIDKTGISKDIIIGVGIGMPGFINAKEGINYSYLDTGKTTLAAYLTEKTDLLTYIDNDSSLVALAELKFGIAKKLKNVMIINFSWGIGLGMIIDGKLFRGHSGFAGEFSHIPMSEDGALCACGKQGCLEAEASLLAVSEKAVSGIRNGRISSLQISEDDEHYALVGDSLMEAANKGDQYSIELISEAAYMIGRGLSILIHITNPEIIAISGRGAKVGKLLLAPIQNALNKYCIPRLASGTEIVISDLGYDSELTGAGILVMENLNK
ncbi:MAG: hypothetical protein JWN56_1094 [Sphingobacteriales bacterium]|nr:hypothetical protein [Sphingobacteriales bacterium]